MTIRPIRNEADHAVALKRMETLWSAAPESDEAAELDAIATLVDAYEYKLFVVSPTEPHEVLAYAIAEMGRSEDELASLIGSQASARQVLNGERPLTVAMIRSISAAWRIPADLLIGSSATPFPETTAAV